MLFTDVQGNRYSSSINIMRSSRGGTMNSNDIELEERGGEASKDGGKKKHVSPIAVWLIKISHNNVISMISCKTFRCYTESVKFHILRNNISKISHIN